MFSRPATHILRSLTTTRISIPHQHPFSTSRTMAAFERLIRFQTDSGKVVFGDLGKETPTREIEGSSVEVLEGDVKSGFRKTGGKEKVGKLLAPLESTNIVLCVGLNYRRHAEECNVRVCEGAPFLGLHGRTGIQRACDGGFP